MLFIKKKWKLQFYVLKGSIEKIILICKPYSTTFMVVTSIQFFQCDIGFLIFGNKVYCNLSAPSIKLICKLRFLQWLLLLDGNLMSGAGRIMQ